MPRLLKKISKKIALPPGTLVYIGEKKVAKVRITLIDYDEANLEERESATIEECFPFRDLPTTTWINIDGVHDVDVIEKIGKHFNLHPLLLEDVMNTGQRAKIEDFDSYVFVVAKMLSYDQETRSVQMEQVSLVLGKNYVISFQERPGDVFEAIRERVRKGKGRIRKGGADYLIYALLDAMVDGYFLVLERMGDIIESAEEELTINPAPQTLETIRMLKREMVILRRFVWPLREVIGGLHRGESALIQKATGIYLRDVYDHTIQVMDTIESLRDMVSGMLDVYLSSMSNKMNEVMKVLTIFAAIFIPLTFIAGIYGMNFESMPELGWQWGYRMVLIVMGGIATGLLCHFRRKRWL